VALESGGRKGTGCALLCSEESDPEGSEQGSHTPGGGGARENRALSSSGSLFLLFIFAYWGLNTGS
jgi:hypothetical protein